MTEMVHYLAELPQGLELEALDEAWRERVHNLSEVRFGHWLAPPDWLRESPRNRVDWGTLLVALSGADVKRLLDGAQNPPGRYVGAWVELC